MNSNYSLDDICDGCWRKLRRANPIWTPEEKDLLRHLYSSASQEEIKQAFPSRRWDTIQQYASKQLKVKRAIKGPGNVDRPLSLGDAAALIGMASETFERYAKEIPFDRTYSGAFRFNKQEVLDWYRAKVAAGELRERNRPMVPSKEGSKQLRKILAQLPIDSPEFAELLELPFGTLTNYLTARNKYIPQEVITNAEVILNNYLYGSKIITSRLPVDNASKELRSIKEQLGITRAQFAELLKISTSTLTLYLYPKTRKVKTIPAKILKKARKLLKELKAKVRHPTFKEVKEALKQMRGIRSKAAKYLKITESHLNLLIERYDLETQAQHRHAVDRITPKQLLQLSKRHRGNKAAMARALGVNRTTVIKLLKMANIKV